MQPAYPRVLLVAFLMWALGVASGLAYVGLSGGWYRYATARLGSEASDMIDSYGYEYVAHPDQYVYVLRRPRFRLP